MSTTVTQWVLSADSLAIPAVNYVGWTDTTNADGSPATFYAVADLTDAEGWPVAQPDITKYLFAKFNFSIPTTATILGLEVKVVRKAIGNIADAGVYLGFADNTSENLSAPKSNSGDWSTTDQTSTYGSSSDLWSESWTPAIINDADFGVALRARQSVSPGFNLAYIDAIKLSVTYQNIYSETGSGGVACGGSATVQFTDYIDATGGVAVGGHAPYNDFVDTTGGVVAAGSADVVSFFGPTGGVVVAGDPAYGVIRRVYEWNVPLSPDQEVTPNDSTASGFASIDVINNVLYWRITYEGLSSGFTGAHFYHGDAGVNGSFQIAIPPNSLDGTMSPMVGKASITGTQATQIRNGEWYINIFTTSNPMPNGEIRGQIWNIGAAAGGVADLTFIDQIDGTGGVVAGGTAHAEHGLFGTGGVTCAGTADVTVNYNIGGDGGIVGSGFSFVDPYIATGGVEAGGSATQTTYWSDAAEGGGVVVGGEALIPWDFTPSGGAVAWGAATVQRVFTIPEWSVDLDTDQVVGGSDSTATAHADFWYDPIESRLSWKVTYSGFDGPVTVARLRVGAPGQNGHVAVEMFDYSDGTASGFTGMVQVTDDEDQLRAGNWYLMLGTSTDKIRSQLWHFGVQIGGEAVVEPYYEIPNGGVVVGGEALVDPIWAEGGAVTGGTAGVTSRETRSAKGGVVVGGIALKVANLDTTGGVVVGGDSIDSQVEANIDGLGGIKAGGKAIPGISSPVTGGVVVGGAAEIEFIYNHSVTGGVVVDGSPSIAFTYNLQTSGGVVIAGNSIIAIHIVARGGIVVAGDPGFAYTSNPVHSGGAVVGGVARQTFFDYVDGTGGMVTGGRARQEKIKFFQKFKQGYCRAMASENICTVVLDTSEQLIIPHDEVSPDLDPNRFRIEHVPTWCDVNEKLQPYNKVVPDRDCDAALAEVIVKRQNGIVPKKVRPSIVRERQIAAAGNEVAEAL